VNAERAPGIGGGILGKTAFLGNPLPEPSATGNRPVAGDSYYQSFFFLQVALSCYFHPPKVGLPYYCDQLAAQFNWSVGTGQLAEVLQRITSGISKGPGTKTTGYRPTANEFFPGPLKLTNEPSEAPSDELTTRHPRESMKNYRQFSSTDNR